MSESEYKIADGAGKFLQAVKEGRRMKDAEWTNGRILLSNKRIVLAGNDGKRNVPLSKVASLSGRYDVNQTVAQVSDYITLQLSGESVLLVSMGGNTEQFETKLYGALLDQTELLVKHPAVKGGVVQDASFERARIKVDEDQLSVALQNGSFVSVDLDDVGSAEAASLDVQGEKSPVLKVEHTVEDASVQTYFSSDSHTCSILESLLTKEAEKSQGSVDLSETEKRVLMALYSGVSSFEIPDFLGMDVDEVESIFERLIEVDVLEEVRKRREVTMKTRGRNIASEAINEE
ncbi:chemotaxis protein CheF1 [Halobacterium sp. KA-6]|uniref:chemotaxis protein CheF1 n=1 Tax=Halobacterium sp. KA-6 TaxID=2896368 RepID=UPI001E6453C8|nr:chemotaxis protein CheF1 [Halobacterium sp. KA-6]MCD2204994.1 CheF family chemotaxis protein [Halobacterium sp. KA-6]